MTRFRPIHTVLGTTNICELTPRMSDSRSVGAEKLMHNDCFPGSLGIKDNVLLCPIHPSECAFPFLTRYLRARTLIQASGLI